jgi:hypothetical protein
LLILVAIGSDSNSIYCPKKYHNSGCEDGVIISTVSAGFSIADCYWACEREDCKGWLMNWGTGDCGLYKNSCIQEFFNSYTGIESDYYEFSDCGMFENIIC